jgi:hypothetical protein
MIDTNEKVHLIRESEKLESITDNERMPEHLKKFEL